jgi:hypothetical protein
MAAVIYPIIRADNFGAGVRHVADLMELTLTGKLLGYQPCSY